MDTKTRLDSLNRLLADVYGYDVRISTLLEAYLSPAQLACLKAECLDDFLRALCFAIGCRFATVPKGMRLYAILSARYGLEDGDMRTYAEVGKMVGMKRERVCQLEDKALQWLRLTKRHDLLRQLACLCARAVLGMDALPPEQGYQPTPARLGRGVAVASPEDAFATIPVTEESLQESYQDRKWRRKKRTAPANQGKPWTPALDEELIRRFYENATQAQLAQEMGRSLGSIQSRLMKHGLIDEDGQEVERP